MQNHWKENIDSFLPRRRNLFTDQIDLQHLLIFLREGKKVRDDLIYFQIPIFEFGPTISSLGLIFRKLHTLQPLSDLSVSGFFLILSIFEDIIILVSSIDTFSFF
ncbi:hypothetical protein OCU04_006868 [Sclerotinia nivalis]|uniref:Uncharacterized protein n=1 Tax=Sclerotinia nivalis TaxID=352851 RepID=A0A9X0ALJ8_9HELO|nr:hypothetical protein OCU04_006868 [Sclerotinia nivalis]